MAARSSNSVYASRLRLLLAQLYVAAALSAAVAPAVAADSLDQQLDALSEQSRFVPIKAIGALDQLEPQMRTAGARSQAQYLSLKSMAYRGAGQTDRASQSAQQLFTLGRTSHDDVILAKGLLARAYVAFARDDLTLSHQLVWEAERVAARGDDTALKIETAIVSGQSFAEDGVFPAALARLQAATVQARRYGDPLALLKALNALAFLHGQTKNFDKGFEVLAEAIPLAEQLHSLARLSSLKNTEYGLSVETGQHARGLKALHEALAYQRTLGADTMIVNTLVNLSDSYLQQRDYAHARPYAAEALAAALRHNQPGSAATARLNIGHADIGLGRLSEGKRSVEEGLAWYEKTGDKPELQSVLIEYGASLERAGDLAGAVRAYHRERTLSDELFEERRQKATLSLQAQYETEKKQRQIELLQRENQVKSAEIYSRTLEQRMWWLLALVLALASAIVGILYRNVRHANAQLHVKNLELKQQSSRDPLTGLYNRRHFQEFMRAYQASSAAPSPQADDDVVGALFLLDVDHFKNINDRQGHAAGDAVLRAISESLREILRETDMIVRWGGEEFLAFLPTIRRHRVDEIARRLLNGISELRVEYQGAEIITRVSIGFAPFPLAPDGQALPWERAVNLVDMALYMAKAHGRNRAYGVRGFANFHQTSMEDIEQDLERAWRAGFVDLHVVVGDEPPVPVLNVA